MHFFSQNKEVEEVQRDGDVSKGDRGDSRPFLKPRFFKLQGRIAVSVFKDKILSYVQWLGQARLTSAMPAELTFNPIHLPPSSSVLETRLLT